MNAVWEISGELGKSLGAGKVSIENSGIEDASLTLEGLEVDQLSWSQRLGAIPDRFQQVALWRDGVRVFSGQVTKRPFVYQRSARLGYAVTVSGPMWWLANTKITDEATDATGTTQERTSIQFPPGDLAASVRRLIDRAEAAGLPIRAGTIDPMFSMGRMTFSGVTFLNALVDMLKPVADASTYVDYSVDGVPTLNIVRRSKTMPSRNLGIGVDDIQSISLAPRDELRSSGVRVLSAARDSSGALVFGEQIAGDNTRPQIVTVSGPEIGSFVIPSNLPSVQIQTTVIAADFAEASDLDSSIKPAIPLGLPGLALAGSGAVYSLYNGTGVGASLIGMTAIVGIFADQETGAPLGGSTWHRITTGQVVDFLKTDYGLIEKGIEIKSEYWTRLAGDLATNLNAYPGLRYLRDQGKCRSNSGYVNQVPGDPLVTDFLVTGNYSVNGISLGFPTLQTVYARDAYEYLEPPANLAQNLFDAQNFTPWEGGLDLNPGVPWQRWLASRLNVMNGPEELETAGAIVQGVQLNVRTGALSLRVGAPARVGMSAVASKYTAASDKDSIITV